MGANMIGGELPSHYAITVRLVTAELESAFEALDRCFELGEDALAYQPSGGGWSIAAILEHVTLTDHFLLLVIRKGRDKALKRAAAGMAIQGTESDLEALAPIGHPDTFPWLRPDHMVPTGGLSSDDIRIRLHTQHQEALAILRSLPHGEGSLHLVRMSVRDLGKLDLYQWLAFLALHARRHHIEAQRVYEEWSRPPPQL